MGPGNAAASVLGKRGPLEAIGQCGVDAGLAFGFVERTKKTKDKEGGALLLVRRFDMEVKGGGNKCTVHCPARWS